MGLFRKKRESKTSDVQKVNENSEEAKLKTLQSIYPYFKQFMPSTGDSVELPTDLQNIDKSKVYHHPSIKLVKKNICEDLNCLYAIDNEFGYEIIQQDKLKELNLTEDELHQIALNNYRQLISTNLKTHGDTNGIMFTVNGNLEAGLILIDEIWEQLENQIGEEVVVAVPSRDVVIATGKSNRAMIDNFSEKAKTVLEGGDHPLSENWFIRKDNKWELFEPIIK